MRRGRTSWTGSGTRLRFCPSIGRFSALASRRLNINITFPHCPCFLHLCMFPRPLIPPSTHSSHWSPSQLCDFGFQTQEMNRIAMVAMEAYSQARRAEEESLASSNKLSDPDFATPERAAELEGRCRELQSQRDGLMKEIRGLVGQVSVESVGSCPGIPFRSLFPSILPMRALANIPPGLRFSVQVPFLWAPIPWNPNLI